VAQPTGMQFVGIDLHQDSVTLACLPADVEEREGDTVQLPNDPSRIKRYFQRVLKSGPVKACYEAGACGYSLYRQLRAWGVDCDVIAPSLIPKRAGDRRKTDRRDAQKLARHLRAGELTAIDVPDEPRERVRALVRARGALRQDVHRCKQRILKLLQVRGHRWGKKTYWTPDFHAWVSRLPWEPLDLLVLGTFDQQLHLLTRLMKDLEREISVQAQGPLYKDVVARLRCLHGVDTLTALSLACEIGDVRRFETPRHLMGWLEQRQVSDLRRDHQGRQRKVPSPARRGRVELPVPAQPVRGRDQAARRTALRDHHALRASTASPPSRVRSIHEAPRPSSEDRRGGRS
jgi:transposase